MYRYKALLFDMDGLIADTEQLHVESYHMLARTLGITLEDKYINSFIGHATRENVKKILRDFNITDRNFDEVLELRYNLYINAVKKSNLKPMEGVPEILQEVKNFVKNFNVKTALVTSSPKTHTVEVLKKIILYIKNYETGEKINNADNDSFYREFFDVIISGDDVLKLKPDPEIYLKASKMLNLPPSKCIAFEDSEAGVTSAKRAGMTVIAVPNYHTKGQKFDLADYKFSSLKEIVDKGFLKKILIQ